MREAQPLNLAGSFKEFEEAMALIPGGVLGIRRPYNFVEGEYPIFFKQGRGGRVTDVDGNEYIDYLCAYGPIILGYREEAVDSAVMEQIQGAGFCFSLSQTYQNRLARKLREIIPCAEMCLFVKTGSDATTCAVRLARSYTGRTKILRCGYHGWHDWCVEVKGGVPPQVYEDVLAFTYNDMGSLRSLLEAHGPETAAVILTPVGHPLGEKIQEPLPGFLEGVKELAGRYGAVLIYDEIRTGFRLSLGGAQEYYGTVPDLAVFGKAMANGYSIGAVVGREEIMRQGEGEVFISSTFFPNSLSLVAALKTIEILEHEAVLETIRNKGDYLIRGIRRSLQNYPLGAEVSGMGPMMFITFTRGPDKIYKEKRKAFYTQLIRRKVFLQPYHHGYVCFRHTQEDLDYTLQAIDESLGYLKEKYGA